MESRLTQNPTARSTESWSFVLTQDGATAVDSDSLGIRMTTRCAAEWLSALVEHLIAKGALPQASDSLWHGDLNDDCHFHESPFRAHAEHMTGPRRGGVWYCAVDDTITGRRYFHTADFPGVEPKTGTAARRLCAMVVLAAKCGFLTDYPT
jgi:hypothetical protein